MPDAPIPKPTADLTATDVEKVLRAMATDHRSLAEINAYAQAWMVARNDRLESEARSAELERLRVKHSQRAPKPGKLVKALDVEPTLFQEAS